MADTATARLARRMLRLVNDPGSQDMGIEDVALNLTATTAQVREAGRLLVRHELIFVHQVPGL